MSDHGVPAAPSGSSLQPQAASAAIPDAACDDQRAIMLRGVGKISGDGWKDTTRIGEVVYAWNAEMPSPYAPGQFPRVGNVCGWCASVEQYEFRPATPLEMRAAVDAIAEDRFTLRCEVNGYRTRVARLESAINAMLTQFGMDEDEWSKPTFDQARAALREEHFQESVVSACWISVDERKPPKHEEVLIAFRDVTLPATGQYTASPHDTWGWSFPSENDPEETGPITHWMPLPLHPREGSLPDRANPARDESPKAASQQPAIEPVAMNDEQFLVGSQILVEAIDDEFLKRGDWRPLAISFAKSAMVIRDAMWRHAIGRQSAAAPEGFALVAVRGLDDLMEALERADRKGYLPHFLTDAWEGFNIAPLAQQSKSGICARDQARSATTEGRGPKDAEPGGEATRPGE